MYEEEPTDLVDDIIRPDPKLGDVIEQCAIHQTHILIVFGQDLLLCLRFREVSKQIFAEVFEVVVIQVLWEPLAFTLPNLELRVKGLASLSPDAMHVWVRQPLFATTAAIPGTS